MAPSTPFADHAALGGGRTAALVAPDGTVDWLCLPALDGTPVCSRLLDSERGGCFGLAPAARGDPTRRYVPETNVLETTWRSGAGTVRVTDALAGGPGSERADPLLVRRVEGLQGEVELAWRFRPRFGDGSEPATGAQPVGGGMRFGGRGLTVAVGAPDCAWDGDAASGRFVVHAGERCVLTVRSAAEPAGANVALAALEETIAGWRTWTGTLAYDGPWRDAVLRSALALRGLVDDQMGSIAAAATMDLPERPGGSRNYDYRYCWLRDSSFVVDAFGSLGDTGTSEAYLRWLTRAIGSTAPVLQPMYRLDGGIRAPEHETALAGASGSEPVRAGNRAALQTQLASCGDVLQSTTLLLEHGGTLPDGLAALLARAVDHIAQTWREDDCGIWETDPPRAHTWSKMACWVALTRAAELAEDDRLPGDAPAWRREACNVRDHVEREHWSDARGAYAGVAGEDGLDAAVLLGVLMGYPPAQPDRWQATLARLDDELGEGALLYRTSDLRDEEATFLPCAFWRAHALTRLGRLDEAREALDALVALATPLGLYAEEAWPDGRPQGNFPQALTHAAFVNAAVTFHQRSSEASP